MSKSHPIYPEDSEYLFELGKVEIIRYANDNCDGFLISGD